MIRFARRTKAGKLPHGPQFAAIARGMNAARKRELPRQFKCGAGRPFEIECRVQWRHFHRGICERDIPFSSGVELRAPLAHFPTQRIEFVLLLPHHVFEIHPELGISFSQGNVALESWSSFPSDHAVLFFTLAAGLWLISRPIGLIALFHAIFVVCLPRIYLGLHYPTDIIAGAFLGIGIALLASRSDWRTRVARPLMKYADKSPSWFYSGFFLLTFQISEMFDSSRHVLRGVFKLLSLILPH